MKHFLPITLSFFSLATFSIEGAAVKFELPVNWTSSPHYNFEVTIPAGYTSLQDFQEWEKATLIEFVPQGENGDNWSEIISVNRFVDQKLVAADFLNSVKEKLLSQVEQGKVWVDTSTKFPDYQEAMLILSYDNKQVHEIMGGRYASGPYDCAGVQYTIRSDDNEKAISKITAFFKTATQISSGTD